MTGIVPSEEFNEQIKRTVREAIRRQRPNTGPPGRWHKKGGGGGGVTTVRFQIASADPSILTVLGDVLSWDAGFQIQQIPGLLGDPELPINVISICDPSGCFFNEPADELFDRIGWCRRMTSDYGDNCRTGYAPYDDIWEVFSLCCATPDCLV